jgi:hypothetical protein
MAVELARAAYDDVKCDNCPHTLSGHNEGHDCHCEKFVYPKVAPAYSADELVRRFSLALEPGASRDTIDEALNDIFGRRYSREMKGLMRDAFKEGLRRGGIDVDAIADLVDERAITKMWDTQGRYTRHIKNDLRAEIASGRVDSVESLRAWFERNDYRSVMTGRFMAWQGLNAGFARASKSRGRKLQWTLGPAEHHCETCLARAGHRYTYDELVGIGFPGSDALQCKSQCRCSVREV